MQSPRTHYAFGNSRVAFAMATAFASPPSDRLRSGGIHFKGRSSIGKSTLLIAPDR
jgi:hypothetical protein